MVPGVGVTELGVTGQTIHPQEGAEGAQGVLARDVGDETARQVVVRPLVGDAKERRRRVLAARV